MKHVFKTDKGTVVLDPDNDKELYHAPRNPPNTGTEYTRGEDLQVHTTRKGTKQFYKYIWTMWQTESDDLILLDEEAAKDFFIEKMGLAGIAHPEDDEIERAKELWPDILEETA